MNYLNEIDETIAISLRAVDEARRIGDPWNIARALYQLANQTLGIDYGRAIAEDRPPDYIEPKRMAEECVRLLGECGDLWLTACTYGFLLGNINRIQGNYAEARRLSEQSLVLFEEIGQSWAMGASHRMLGYRLWDSGDYAASIQHYLTGLRIFADNGQAHEQLWLLLSLAELYFTRSDPERAVRLLTLIHRASAPFDESFQLAQDQLKDIAAEMPAEKYQAAVEQGQTLKLEAAIRELLATEDTSGWLPVQRPPQRSADSLTERELEILKLMADGLTNRAIAEKLFLSIGTVKWYSSQILSKLHAENRIQALARAQELHLLA
jgi:DNA-binding CsgD family transcriptional regulator